MIRLVPVLAVLLASAGPASAQTVAPAPDLQRIYDSYKTLIGSSSDEAEKTAVVQGLLADIDAGGAARHAAAHALHYALLPFHQPGWTPAQDLAERIVEAAASRLEPSSTPDADSRRLLVAVIGQLGGEAVPVAAMAEEALARAASHDPDAHVAETAVIALVPALKAGSPKASAAVEGLRSDPRPTIRGLFGQNCPSAYVPVASDADVAELQRSASSSLQDAVAAAEALALRGKDIAANPTRDPAGPKASAGDATWGGGGDAQSLLRGELQYNNDFGYGTGPALPGGQGALRGVQAGWQQITIDLAQPRLVGQVRITTYGAEYTPKSFRVLVRDPRSPTERWAVAYETTANGECLGAGLNPGCVITVSFSDVKTDRVRLEIDGSSVQRHLWLQRVEVSSQPQPAPAG